MGFELAAVVFVAAYLYVSLHVLDQPIAVALVFLAVFYRLGPKILGVQENLFRALSNATWLEDCVALAETAQRAVDPTTGTRSPTFSERLEVRELTFAHAGALEPLLRDVSMDLGPRECVAVVGPSGQGKSTLLDVIIGLHQPSSGLVMLDGVDLREVDLRAWRRRVGFVLQDSPIFNATIRDNIVLDRVPLAPDRFDKVCEQAGVTEFVRRMPQGHDTIVGERGSQISGGQRQRIALARALYREPWLLVLDEATSSLDAATEGLILERLGQLKGELAMLIVSHGERVLRLADRVYNVDHGRVEVVEQHGARG
jgi:ATP-binding cassette subfamily C protein